MLVLKAKDNATGNLLAGISASDLSIPLEPGDGATFPQPYTGSCTSLGTISTLNCTGIGAVGLAVGDQIRNVTDGSLATVETISTNSITTTKLKGGTLNLWSSADVWRVNELIATFASIDDEGNDTAFEEALVSNRSTDTLTVPTGGRGYNGTVAQTWPAGTYVQLRISSPYFEEPKAFIRQINKAVDTNTDAISTNNTTLSTAVANLQQGFPQYVVATGSSNAYAISPSPALGAYTAGNEFIFKANFDSTGAATLNVSALGAKTIKRKDGATDIASGDIKNGQLVLVRYDGTNFQMLSPPGTDPSVSVTYYEKVQVAKAADSTTLTNPTSGTAYDTHVYTIPANWFVDGSGVEFEFTALINHGTAGTFRLFFTLGGSGDSTDFGSASGSSLIATLKGKIMGTTTPGAAASLRYELTGIKETGCVVKYGAANYATNGTLALDFRALFGTGNAGNTTIGKMSKIKRFSTTPF